MLKIRLTQDGQAYRICKMARGQRFHAIVRRDPKDIDMMKTNLLVIFLVVAAIAIALTIIDVMRDPGPLDVTEVLISFANEVLLLGAMAAVARTMQRVGDLSESHDALANNIARSIAQGEAWREERREEIAALGQAIEQQFKLWRLTEAEIDIAGLMLKGASQKEIALARNTSEATIRQQAQSVYRKSGLSGRAELSAYFLESLFATAEDTATQRSALRVV